MPVKIRCRQCEKVLNAPDAARGKVVKCPQCGTKLKVPSSDSSAKSASAGASRRKESSARKSSRRSSKRQHAKAPSAPLSDTDFFANLDIDQAEDTQSRICPYCATELEPENDVCPGCGMNVVLGQMDAKEADRRTRKGPDPSKFYSEAWTESWAFVKKRKDLALRTGWYLTVFVVLSFACIFMVGYSTTGPPKTFWSACSFLAMMGLPGWYFYLSMRIVEFSMSGQKKMDRVHFDFFQCVTLGMRTIFWPAVMLLPFSPLILLAVLLGVASGNFMATIALLVLLAIIPLLVLPLAIVHMTAPYTYKAWILWELGKVFVKNAGAALYWVMMFVALFLLPCGLIIGALHFFGGGVNPFYNVHFVALTEKLVAAVLGLAQIYDGWFFTTVLVMTRLVLALVLSAPILMVAGFPLAFLMRANGLLGYYRKNNLDLVLMMASNTPCGFWVRMLAYFVDVLLAPLASVIVTKYKRAVIVAHLLNVVLAASIIYLPPSVFPIAITVWSVYMSWMYFCIPESTTHRSTIGKDGFGLIVSTEDNKQMTLKQATVRFFCSFVTVLTLYLGFVMCAFHPQKRALHDLMSKTKVVWQGDR